MTMIILQLPVLTKWWFQIMHKRTCTGSDKRMATTQSKHISLLKGINHSTKEVNKNKNQCKTQFYKWIHWTLSFGFDWFGIQSEKRKMRLKELNLLKKLCYLLTCTHKIMMDISYLIFTCITSISHKFLKHLLP